MKQQFFGCLASILAKVVVIAYSMRTVHRSES